jgi:predicted transport protein
VTLESGFSRDVTDIGHLGTGELEVNLRCTADLEKAKPLFLKSYENS